MNLNFEIKIKKIARSHGLLETIHVVNPKNTRGSYKPQYEFLIVLDFESTCWEDRIPNRQPEIIEFSAVLLNVNSGLVEDEFQQYVMPFENPVLSKFCTRLTGIQQHTVDEGVPLKICLSLFSKWLQNITKTYNLVFLKEKMRPGCKLCAFVTWSDWDLAVCLSNECRRKQIHNLEVFNQWIDIRALYRQFYQRKPHGLRGALSEVGREFIGNEHCGLDDARNTAYLVRAMVNDKVELEITTDLQADSRMCS